MLTIWTPQKSNLQHNERLATLVRTSAAVEHMTGRGSPRRCGRRDRC